MNAPLYPQLMRQTAQAPPRLGELLLRDRAISRGALTRALEQQRQLDAPLGQLLLAAQAVKPAALDRALCLQSGTARARFEDLPPDHRLTAQLPPALALEHEMLPWRQEGGRVLVATTRPDLRAQLARSLPAGLRPAQFVYAPPEALQAAQAQAYGPELLAHAEARPDRRFSCRDWSGLRTFLTVICVTLALLVLSSWQPGTPMALFMGLALTVLCLNTGLKAACLLAALRKGRNPPLAVLPLPKLPRISILVPLFRETRIAEALLARLLQLDYPKALLEICFLMEAEDQQTRATLGRSNLPAHMRVITVPPGSLRTKPRAMNYALDFTQGQIVGIYDAEDAPAPDQLRQVAARFADAPADLACLQGILSFYNHRAGWLARCFAFEYAGWFRVMLPGLCRLGMAIPLGGTTLFFRREALVKLGAWDAHNVTEDADLGLRLARFGYRAEMIETVTEEEANARAWPWIRQRSRWLKGYAMTYAVHMRSPLRLWRDLGAWRFLGVQLLFLGTLLAFTLAPLLWAASLGFAFGFWEVSTLGALVPLFLVCEGVNLTLFALGWARLGARPSLIWALTLPLYFTLATVAAYKGLLELVFAPFYWDKTEHGVS